ncbi:MAG: FliI/YscN family ATPase [Cycloclasticus sp.]
MNFTAPMKHAILRHSLIKRVGKVTQIFGLIIESDGPDVTIGEQVEVYSSISDDVVHAEVIGIKNNRVIMMPYEDISGIKYGSEVIGTGRSLNIPVGDQLLGRVIDPFGRPLDDMGEINASAFTGTHKKAINPLSRPPITEKFETGVKIIDTLIPMGRGQRMGLFAGSGVGKSSLLAMIAKDMSSDVNVIALIGERGREVREFIDKHLTAEVLSRSVVVVATSDTSALMRRQAALTATTIAEYFRDKGQHTALLMDSITRYAMALREIALSVGEPPTSRGYTPSVFSDLPKLLERCGTGSSGGSITAIYTVLVEGDDLNEPISDHIRATIDGHIVLSRAIAQRSLYPAIDVLKSESRLKQDILSDEELTAGNNLKRLIAEYEESRDLVEIGAYKTGSNPLLDQAILKLPKIKEFITQDLKEVVKSQQSFKQLATLLEGDR